MTLAGGWGQVAWGQHEWGAGQSVIEPRFNLSDPVDGKYNVSREVWIEYEMYYYSSFPVDSPESLAVFEVSEDGGASYNPAVGAPYALTTRFLGGHRLWVKIVKTGLWADDAEIILRTTVNDEFGQEITKELPIRWET